MYSSNQIYTYTVKKLKEGTIEIMFYSYEEPLCSIELRKDQIIDLCIDLLQLLK